jgi:GNAT superfamily N-acetyltransferase
MLNLVRTTATNPEFLKLIVLLDKELKERDGVDHAFFATFNKVDSISEVLVLMNANNAVACGAIKKFDNSTMEIKRMYVLPEYRGLGYASKVLQELETWTAELGYSSCVLETGEKQFEAVHLYKKQGYQIIPNYGQYALVETSICFEKKLN